MATVFPVPICDHEHPASSSLTGDPITTTTAQQQESVSLKRLTVPGPAYTDSQTTVAGSPTSTKAPAVIFPPSPPLTNPSTTPRPEVSTTDRPTAAPEKQAAWISPRIKKLQELFHEQEEIISSLCPGSVVDQEPETVIHGSGAHESPMSSYYVAPTYPAVDPGPHPISGNGYSVDARGSRKDGWSGSWHGSESNKVPPNHQYGESNTYRPGLNSVYGARKPRYHGTRPHFNTWHTGGGWNGSRHNEPFGSGSLPISIVTTNMISLTESLVSLSISEGARTIIIDPIESHAQYEEILNQLESLYGPSLGKTNLQALTPTLAGSPPTSTFPSSSSIKSPSGESTANHGSQKNTDGPPRDPPTEPRAIREEREQQDKLKKVVKMREHMALLGALSGWQKSYNLKMIGRLLALRKKMEDRVYADPDTLGCKRESSACVTLGVFDGLVTDNHTGYVDPWGQLVPQYSPGSLDTLNSMGGGCDGIGSEPVKLAGDDFDAEYAGYMMNGRFHPVLQAKSQEKMSRSGIHTH